MSTRGSRGPKAPPGLIVCYGMHCNSHPKHQTAQVPFYNVYVPLNINTKLQNIIYISLSHNDSSLPSLVHNVTNYSLILSPYAILHSPLHCNSVASPGVHFFAIVVVCSFIGSLGDHSSCITNPLDQLLLVHALPDGHWRLYCNHMQVCMAIT